MVLAALGHSADRGGEAKVRSIDSGILETFDVMTAQRLLATDQHAKPHKLLGVAAEMSLRQCKCGIEQVVTLQ